MIPISLYTGWVKSVVYVSALSLWALASGHWSAWQAARVEVAQQAEERAREKDSPPMSSSESSRRRTSKQLTRNDGCVPRNGRLGARRARRAARAVARSEFCAPGGAGR
jgi:hypothetical protein